ncbi:MAG: putative ATPase [Phenylobacterium sp.]|jgi:predicted ATPase
MIFEFENLGPVKKGRVELGDLTVICGRNNVGKTYISHSIWGLLNQQVHDLVDVSIEGLSDVDDEITHYMQTKSIMIKLDDIKISIKLKQHSQQYSEEGLKTTFNTDSDMFNNTQINLNMFKTPNQNGITELCLSDDEALSRKLVEQLQSLNKFNEKKMFFHSLKNSDGEFIEMNFTDEGVNVFKGANLSPDTLFIELIKMWIKVSIFPNTKIITSERTGIALFLPDLDKKASEITRKLQRNTASHELAGFVKNEMDAYPTYGDPVQDNIDRIRAASSQKQQSELIVKNPTISAVLSDLIGGTFNSGSDGIAFTTNDNQAMPLHVVSSSAKSLFLIEHYLKKEAKIGDLLIIDEPELNLHLDNQVRMAHLIALLINSGLKILITTHSDHLLRELNNLIMLSSAKIDADKRAELIEQYNIPEQFHLKPERVKAFVVSKQEQQVFDMDISETGMKMELFNQEINQNNRQTKDIYFSLLDSDND